MIHPDLKKPPKGGFSILNDARQISGKLPQFKLPLLCGILGQYRKWALKSLA